MARGLNRISLIGNLGNAPELRYTADGSPVCNASLAVNGFRRNADNGENEETVEWFRLVLWNHQAETFAEYGRRGKRVYVEGRFQTRPYTDRSGAIRTAHEVVVGQFLLLGPIEDDQAEDANVPEEPEEMRS